MTTQSNSIKEEKSIKYYLPHIFGGIILLALVALIALIIFDNTNKELYFAGGEDPTGSEYNPCAEGLKYCPPVGYGSPSGRGCCYDPEKYQCTHPLGRWGVCNCPKNNLVCINPLYPNLSICCYEGNKTGYACSYDPMGGAECRKKCASDEKACTVKNEATDPNGNKIELWSFACCKQDEVCSIDSRKEATCIKNCPSGKACTNMGLEVCCKENEYCTTTKEGFPECVPRSNNQ